MAGEQGDREWNLSRPGQTDMKMLFAFPLRSISITLA